MEEHAIKCALVSRMWNDGIVMNRQYADVESVVRQAAVARSDEGAAKDLLTGDMVDDDHCPVVKTGAGMVSLKQDKEAVRDYLERFCDDESDLPWDLR